MTSKVKRELTYLIQLTQTRKLQLSDCFLDTEDNGPK